MFKFMSDMFEFTNRRKEERKDAAERALIAKTFNDRYSFRLPYRPTGVRRQFTPAEGLDDWFPDQAWMCPTCNLIHMTIGRSFLTGMHFPKCCEHPEGHRHYADIRKP